MVVYHTVVKKCRLIISVDGCNDCINSRYHTRRLSKLYIAADTFDRCINSICPYKIFFIETGEDMFALFSYFLSISCCFFYILTKGSVYKYIICDFKDIKQSDHFEKNDNVQLKYRVCWSKKVHNIMNITDSTNG